VSLQCITISKVIWRNFNKWKWLRWKKRKLKQLSAFLELIGDQFYRHVLSGEQTRISEVQRWSTPSYGYWCVNLPNTRIRKTDVQNFRYRLQKIFQPNDMERCNPPIASVRLLQLTRTEGKKRKLVTAKQHRQNLMTTQHSIKIQVASCYWESKHN